MPNINIDKELEINSQIFGENLKIICSVLSKIKSWLYLEKKKKLIKKIWYSLTRFLIIFWFFL